MAARAAFLTSARPLSPLAAAVASTVWRFWLFAPPKEVFANVVRFSLTSLGPKVHDPRRAPSDAVRRS
eukprot:3621875-Alexandrium_andersonii.AAC.1